MSLMPLLKCLCYNSIADGGGYAVSSREQWAAFAAQHPEAMPGQLMEKAIEQDRVEVVLGILQNTNIDINQPCDPNRYGSVSPLMTALRAGNARIVRLIAGQPQFGLAQSLPEYERWSWVRSSSLELLQLYLSIPGGDVNQKNGNGKTLLHEVVYDLGGQEKLRDLLAQPGIDFDTKQVDGTTPLYRAVLAGNAEAVQLLLDRGADVNNRNNDNLWTILICASADNRVAIVEQLLRRREIEINAADEIQNTALHIAALRGHTETVKLLLQHPDVQVNLKDYMGWTPLSKAAFADHLEVVRLLLGRPELEVNFVDQDRQTPLFHAVSAGNLEVVRLLLADPRTNAAISNWPARHTALDMARALGLKLITELIEQQGSGTDVLSPLDTYTARTVESEPIIRVRPQRPPRT